VATCIKSFAPCWGIRSIWNARVGNPDDPADRELLANVSPLFAADRINIPMLIAQGARIRGSYTRFCSFGHRPRRIHFWGGEPSLVKHNGRSVSFEASLERADGATPHPAGGLALAFISGGAEGLSQVARYVVSGADCHL
jgi:hypothetical protein